MAKLNKNITPELILEALKNEYTVAGACKKYSMKTLQILIGISIVFYLIIILVLNPICQQKGYAHMSIDGCYN